MTAPTSLEELRPAEEVARETLTDLWLLSQIGSGDHAITIRLVELLIERECKAAFEAGRRSAGLARAGGKSTVEKDPSDDPEHQCGGPREACGMPGCSECGTPRPSPDGPGDPVPSFGDAADSARLLG